MTRATRSVRLNREMREGTLPPTLIAKTYHPGNVTDVSRPLIRSLSYEFQCHQRKLRDCLSLYSLNNVITEPTRINEHSSTLIDPCLVSDACIVLDSGTMAVSDIISDHRATYVSIKIDLKLSSSYFREVWDYKHADYERLNDLNNAIGLL